MDAKLFSPFTIRNVAFNNRIVMSPMCMYSAENEQGMVEDWHIAHYESRAAGQTGLIILEATAVSPEGRISPKDLGIWSDEHIPGLAKLAERIKFHGAKAGIQLAHAGRKAGIEGEIIAPSPVPFDANGKTPKEMTQRDIKETVEAFQNGAERAKMAGFDVIEIHSAHGYLLNEFLSPLANKRADEYGGSPENRYRIVGEVIAAVRKVWDGPLFVRISANDYDEQGLGIQDYIPIAKRMKEQGVDFIDVSSGGVIPAKIKTYPGYQVRYAETIKREAKIPTGAVGLITTGIQGEEILQNERADLIFIGRELLRDPYFPRRAALELGLRLDAPRQYERGWR